MNTQHSTVLYLETGDFSAAIRSFLARGSIAPHTAFFSCLILFAALLPRPALAALDCVVKSVQMIDGHPNTYIVPTGKTLAIGDLFGTEQTWRITYRCKVSGSPTQWGIAERKVPAVSSTGLLANRNATDNFPILTTPQLEAYGLGFSGWHSHANQWPPSEALLNNDRPVFFWKDLPVADADGYVEPGIDVVSRFSKINDNLDTILDDTPVPVQALPFPVLAFAIRDNESAALSPTAQVTLTMPTLTIAQRACTPFTNTVHMPPITPDELPNIGSIGPEKEFFIEMRCPTNLVGS